MSSESPSAHGESALPPEPSTDDGTPQPPQVDPVTFSIDCTYEDPELYDPKVVGSSPGDAIVRVQLPSFEAAWAAGKPWDYCTAERSGGTDFTSEQIAAANAAGYTDRDHLKYIYAVCAETAGYYVTDGPGSADQRAEVAGMLKLCPDFPSADKLREASADSIREEQERAAGTRFWGSGVYVVGKDVQPGNYATTGAVENCYWARLNSAGDILDNNFISSAARAELVLSPGDHSLEIEGGCGEWSRAD